MAYFESIEWLMAKRGLLIHNLREARSDKRAAEGGEMRGCS